MSTRTKEAIKTGLAIVIVYAIALALGWEKPYWAGFAVAMISLDTAGQSLNKGALRMLGTVVGMAVALILITLFSQQRWLMMLYLSVYYGVCTYMMTGSKRPYFWLVSAFVCLIIIIDAAPDDSLRAFRIAVARGEETGMGILVYSLISVLLWPRSSRGALDEASRTLSAIQRQLYRNYRGLMVGQGTAEESQPLRMREVQLLTELGQALSPAERDSYEVFEVRHQWRHFYEDSTTLMVSLARWRENFPAIQGLDLTKLLPNLEAVGSELEDRFAQIARMLTEEAPTATPKPISLMLDHEALSVLTHFQKAALVVTKAQIDALEHLSRSLFDCVQDIKGFASQNRTPRRIEGRTRRGPALDPDRLAAATRVMAAQWIAFLIWVYLDPPGHALFVFLTAHWTMGAVMLRTNPSALAPGLVLGIVLAGVLYVFLMPHLSGYVELGLMLFGVTFAAFYLLSGVTRSTSMAMFNMHIGIQNTQTYDFASYANTSVAILLALALAVALSYVPRSPRPEKVFLRALRRCIGIPKALLCPAPPPLRP